MVVKHRKKVIRQRGLTSHGWGSKKKHRGGGSRGGRGNCNLMKHKKSYMVKFDPDHFGKRGFFMINKRQIKAINLKQIDEIAVRNNLKEIDISEYGYNKILSTGKLSAPLKIKAQFFSKKTKEKIKGFGGSLIGAEKNGL